MNSKYSSEYYNSHRDSILSQRQKRYYDNLGVPEHLIEIYKKHRNELKKLENAWSSELKELIQSSLLNRLA